jgi:hypothetical protein
VARKSEPAPEVEEPVVDEGEQVDFTDWPRNEFGTLLNPDDGQPVFNTVTGESRQQYLDRTWVENKEEILSQLEASIAADQAAAEPTPTETEE